MKAAPRFTEVDRPAPRRVNTEGLTSAILATGETGKALLLPRHNGYSMSGYYGIAKAAGLRLHSRKTPDGMLVWCEPVATPSPVGRASKTRPSSATPKASAGQVRAR